MISGTVPNAKSVIADSQLTARCLLCGSRECQPKHFLSSGQLRRAWPLLNVTFSPDSWPNIENEQPIYLWKCQNCRFEFSDSNLAGNAFFYQELQAQSSNYYPDASPEFLRAVRFAKRHSVKQILDVGCGGGAFLNLAKAAGLSTFGVELNPNAGELARKAGHEVYEVLVSDLIKENKPPQFDMVTAWQVLEHVSDPVLFLRECSCLVKTGGYLAIAVPFADGIFRLCPYDPHQWPPHHVSRWRLRDLKLAGIRLDLKFVTGGIDVLYGSVGEYFWNLHNRIAPGLGAKSHPGGRWFPRLFWLLYRKAGLRHIMPNRGPGVYAFYQKT